MKKKLFIALGVVVAMHVMAATSPVKLLGIGNSFTEDAMLQELMPVCVAGDFPITFGYPYKGGTTFPQHVQRYNDKEVIYNYKKWEWGKSKIATTGSASYTINAGLTEDQWEIVVFQQCARKEYYSYSAQKQGLDDLLSIVKKEVPTIKKKAYYMYWSDQVGGAQLFPTGQVATWDTIKTSCQRIVKEYKFDYIIPVGTAIQNARTSYLGDHLNRDKHHLSYTHGRYIAALCWYEVLSGNNCIGLSYHPSELTDWAALVCQTAVHFAVTNPYTITDMSKDYGEDKGDDPKEKDTNASLSDFYISGLNTELSNEVLSYTGYANIACDSFPVNVVLSSKSAVAKVYQDDNEVLVSAEPEIYYLTTPKLGKTTSVRIETTAEDSTYTKTYTAVVTGAKFTIANWDLMLLGQTELQNSILASNPYLSNGISLIARQASSDLFNFGDASKPGLYIRNAKESYGSCGLLIKAPAKAKGHLQVQIRPGATDKNYIYYAYAQNAGTKVPEQLYDKTAQSIRIGNVENGLKSLNYLTDGKWLDYSSLNQAQDIYIYHTAGGMRYQRLVYTLVSTEEDPTNINANVNANVNQTTKMMKDNQLLILHNGNKYNVTGNRL